VVVIQSNIAASLDAFGCGEIRAGEARATLWSGSLPRVDWAK
jgi:hypothetical protein